jgi:ketosteroid isomerase-like protein
MMKPLVIVGLLFLASSGSVPSQVRSNPNDEQSTVLALEVLWNQAEQSKDAKAVEQLLGGTLTYIDENGLLMSKSEFVASVGRASFHADQIFNEGMTAQRYGDVILVTGTYRETRTEKGKPFSSRGRFTDVWTKQGGTWLCVASQTTLISPK